MNELNNMFSFPNIRRRIYIYSPLTVAVINEPTDEIADDDHELTNSFAIQVVPEFVDTYI